MSPSLSNFAFQVVQYFDFLIFLFVLNKLEMYDGGTHMVSGKKLEI